MSRLQQAQVAVRPALKGRLMLSGPPGSGKTRSALIMGTELAQGEKIIGIDTEKESMLTYADDFDFVHLRWLPPFNPRELAETLREAAPDYGVIIIDSASHFWRAEGGTLDIANGKYTGWKDARPAHEELVEAILSVPCHVIVCVRSKIGYVQEQETNGQYKVRKLGMEAQQDDNLEFEVNVAVDMAIDHTATISKTRNTVLPIGRAFRAGHVHELAEIYGTWLAAGEPPATAEQVKGITDLFDTIEDEQSRRTAKAAFLATCGRPETLQDTQYAEALGVARRLTAEALAPPSREPNEAGPTQPTATGAAAPTPSSTDAEVAQPGDGEGTDDGWSAEEVEHAIKGLPRARQQACREALSVTSFASQEALLAFVFDFPIEDEPSRVERVMASTEPAVPERLSRKVRELLVVARSHKVDTHKLIALNAMHHGTHEPLPLGGIADEDVAALTALVKRVDDGEIVFETPNGVLIAKEVQPA